MTIKYFNKKPLHYFSVKIISRIVILAIAVVATPAYAMVYQPGQTLNPNCFPTDASCYVAPPLTLSNATTTVTASAASFTATSSSASTFPYASTTAISVSGGNATTSSLTLGSVNGILRAIAGVVQATYVNLASDITGVLSVLHGGTGISTAPSYGKVLLGNASGGYNLVATSSLGISGGSGGSTSPGGSSNQIQFNNSGAFGASSALTFVSTTGTLSATAGSFTSIVASSLSVTGTTNLATTTASKLLTANKGVALTSSIPSITTNTLYNNSNTLYWNGTKILQSLGTSLLSLNGLTATSQSFATGKGGSDFAITSTGNTHTFSIPNAGPTSRGLISTTTQTLAGEKSFTSTTTMNVLSMNTTRITGLALPVATTDATNKAYVDALAQGVSWKSPVIALSTAAAPTTPTTGDRYVLESGATSFGTCTTNQIAQWSGSAWTCSTPTSGWSVYVNTLSTSYNYNGTAWVSLGSTINHNNLLGIQGGQSGQYYHLNLSDYNAVHTGSPQLLALQTTGAPSFQGLTITSSSTLPTSLSVTGVTALNGNTTITGGSTVTATSTTQGLSATFASITTGVINKLTSSIANLTNATIATLTGSTANIGTATIGSLTATSSLAVAGNTTLTNASSTNQTISGYLNVAGQTTLGKASTTELSVSGPAYFNSSTTFNGVEYLFPSSGGTANQVLQTNAGGGLSWGTVSSGSGFFAQTANSLAIHPANISNTLILGASATTTTGNILEVAGNSLFNGNGIYTGTITAPAISIANTFTVGARTSSATVNTSTGTFNPKMDYTTGTGPRSIAVADVNGDGKPDIVVANYAADTVSVLLNSGSGIFATKADYTTGTGPISVAIADVNGDGKPDIVVANYAAGTVSVLLNSGSGTFATKVDYTAGSGPISVAIADVNGDGKPDIVVTNATSNTISVFLNNGSGTFATKMDYTAGTDPNSVAIADVNGDSKPDIVVTNFYSNNVSVFLNNGSGTFATKMDYTAGSYPNSVAVADVNGDGKPDIAVTNYSSGTVSVFLNNGSGTFATKVDYTASVGPESIAIADVNGDGKPDLVVVSSGYNIASVFFNTGNGTFATKVDYTTGSSPKSVAIADVNGDSTPDIVTANNGSNTVSVLTNIAVSSVVTTTTSSAFYVDGATGNVGIGTVSPTNKLDVAGSINISAGSAYKLNGVNAITASTTLSNYFFGSAGNLTMTGSSNTASGINALASNTAGGNNTANGTYALSSNSTGNQNTASGQAALYYNTTGFQNVAMGNTAGAYIADGTTGNTIATSSIYLGVKTKALASGDANETVIGYNATGAGSNSVVLGNSSVIKTILNGNVGIGTTTPVGKLDVSGSSVYFGTGKVDSNLTLRGYNSAIANITTNAGNSASFNGIGIISNPSNKNSLPAWGVDIGGDKNVGSLVSDSFVINRKPSAGSWANLLTVNASGNVGIGTTSPTRKLEVVGGDAKILIDGSVGAAIKLHVINGAWSEWQQTGTATRLNNSSLGGDVLTILNTGNVAIGSATAAQKLTVNGGVQVKAGLPGASNTNGTGYSFSSPGDTDGGMFSTADGTLQFLTNSNTIMTINPSGNIGIGVSSPATKLQVNGDIRVGASGTNGCIQNYAGTWLAGTCSSDARLKTITGNVTGILGKFSSLNLINYHWNDTAANVYHDATTTLNTGFVAQDVQKVFPNLVTTDSKGFYRLNYTTLGLYGLEATKELNNGFTLHNLSSGATSTIASWYIGTTTPAITVLATGNIGIGTTTPYSRLTVWGSGTSSTTSALTIVNAASTTEFQVHDNGNAFLAGSLSQNSDRRLKKNIQPLSATSSLSTITGLTPVNFNWRNKSRTSTEQFGFIAQDVQQIFPSLVSTTSPTKLTPHGTLSVNYIGLISPIVSAIKDLSAQISGFAKSFTTEVLTATTGRFNNVSTKKLCVGNTCINEAELKKILSENKHITGAPQINSTVTVTSVVATPTNDTATSSNKDTNKPVTSSTTPLTISTIKSTTTQSTATIEWKTNKDSKSVVDYGTSTTYASSTQEGSLSKSHKVTLDNLLSNTGYHFRIVSNSASSTATSSESTFKTLSVPIIITQTISLSGEGTATSSTTIDKTPASGSGATIVLDKNK